MSDDKLGEEFDTYFQQLPGIVAQRLAMAISRYGTECYQAGAASRPEWECTAELNELKDENARLRQRAEKSEAIWINDPRTIKAEEEWIKATRRAEKAASNYERLRDILRKEYGREDV